jgi:hypothetical protein
MQWVPKVLSSGVWRPESEAVNSPPSILICLKVVVIRTDTGIGVLLFTLPVAAPSNECNIITVQAFFTLLWHGKRLVRHSVFEFHDPVTNITEMLH